MRFRFIILLCAFLFIHWDTSVAENPLRGLGIRGQSAVYHSFVKSSGFPIGRQLVHSYGGSVNYSASKMSYSAFLNYHTSIHSFVNGLLLYRDYNGYECGINLRRVISEFQTIRSKWGGGFMLYGNYDQYALIKQYMVYPSIGLEVFSSFQPLKTEILPIAISIPVTYSFRQSGHYFNIGLSLQIGVCIP
ncbi:hypothetical protein AGMMS49982_12760 [Bacteroidia bacterium]|nr:hypothetical protein AGMMS49982_12760 [Bacteroidia bacterium]